MLIRTASPDDRAFLAQIVLLGSRSNDKLGYWDFYFEDPESSRLAYLEQLVLQKPHPFCHYSWFRIAEVDGLPVAAVASYAPEETGPHALYYALEILKHRNEWTAKQINQCEERTRAFNQCAISTPEGRWIIDSVATLPAHRGRGYISTLLQSSLNQGRRKGLKTAQLAVFIGNTPAERVYQRLGFEKELEKRHPDFEKVVGCPGIAVWSREL